MRNRKKLNIIIIFAILMIIAILTYFPYYFMIVSSFKNNAEITAYPFVPTSPLRVQNYISAFGMIVKYFKNSIIISGAITAGTSIIAVLSAYVFARNEFPGKNLLYMFLLAFMMIPSVLTLIPLYVEVSNMGLIGTRWAAILPMIATAQIQFIVILRPFIESLPKDLFEAAKLDGASSIQTFRCVAAPLLKASLTSQMLLAFLNSWNDFVWPMLTMASKSELKTITLGLYSFRDVQQIQYGPMYAGFVLASVPMILLFSLNMKSFISGITAGAVKG